MEKGKEGRTGHKEKGKEGVVLSAGHSREARPKEGMGYWRVTVPGSKSM